MKSFAWLTSLVVLAFACSKPVEVRPDPIPVDSHPAMQYTDLKDTAILFGKACGFDLNADGIKDIGFNTLLVGDPVYQQDKLQWMVNSSFYANLPVNGSENIPVMQLKDTVHVNNFNGYSWYNASNVVLAQKIIGMSEPPQWQGEWKDAHHRFIPVQVKKNDGLYNGWVEISFNRNTESLIVHKAGLSKEPNKAVLAGH
jgi:hypothetical protein